MWLCFNLLTLEAGKNPVSKVNLGARDEKAYTSCLLTSCTCTCLAQMIAFSPNPHWEKRDWENLVWFQQDSVPSVVNLIGSKADLSSTTLAQRLGKNPGACYVKSGNCSWQMLQPLSLISAFRWQVKDFSMKFICFSICAYMNYLAYSLLSIIKDNKTKHYYLVHYYV